MGLELDWPQFTPYLPFIHSIHQDDLNDVQLHWKKNKGNRLSDKTGSLEGGQALGVVGLTAQQCHQKPSLFHLSEERWLHPNGGSLMLARRLPAEIGVTSGQWHHLRRTPHEQQAQWHCPWMSRAAWLRDNGTWIRGCGHLTLKHMGPESYLGKTVVLLGRTKVEMDAQKFNQLSLKATLTSLRFFPRFFKKKKKVNQSYNSLWSLCNVYKRSYI